MTPKQLFAAGALVGILAVGGASIASAQDSGSTTTPTRRARPPRRASRRPSSTRQPVDGAESSRTKTRTARTWDRRRVDGNTPSADATAV